MLKSLYLLILILFLSFSFGCVALKKAEPTPTPEPTATPTPQEPSLEKVILSKDSNGTEETTEFKKDDSEIYLIFDAKNLPENTVIKIIWLSVSGETENKISESSIKAGGNINAGSFNLTRPPEGWTSSGCRADIYFDDKLMKSVIFTIEIKSDTPEPEPQATQEIFSETTPSVTSAIEPMNVFYFKTSMTYGKKESKFTVWINDKYLGEFNEDTDMNISNMLHTGKNTVAIVSSLHKNLVSYINLSIGSMWRGKDFPILIHKRQLSGEDTIHYTLNIPDVSGIKNSPPPEEYNLKIAMVYGSPKSTFTVFINGFQMGIYSRDVSLDVTPFIRTGKNEVKIISDVEKNNYGIKMILGSLRWGKWATVISHSRNTAGKDTALYKLNIPDFTKINNPVLSETYILKTNMDFGTYSTQTSTFEVFINDIQLGIFNDSTSVEINNYLKPGKNSIKVKSNIEKNLMSDITLTVGTDKNGKWNTLINHGRSLQGNDTKTYGLMVSGENIAVEEPSDQCTMKVNMTFKQQGCHLTVHINDEFVGRFDSSTSIDVNGFLKKGKNKVRIETVVSKNLLSGIGITIGANRDGKWATLLSHERMEQGTYNDDYTVIVK